MRLRTGLAAVIGVLAAGAVYAAEEGGASSGPPTTWGNFYIPQERMTYFREVVETVRDKYPDEFNEVMAMRQTNPGEAIRRGIELARRAGFDVPSGLTTSGVSPLESGQEQSFSVVGKTGAVSRDSRRKKMRAVNQALEERFPEDYAHLEELRSSDPEEARYYFRELVSRLDDLQEIFDAIEPAAPAEEEMPGSGRRRFGGPRGGAPGFPPGNGAFAAPEGGEKPGAGKAAAAPGNGDAGGTGEKAAPSGDSALPWWME